MPFGRPKSPAVVDAADPGVAEHDDGKGRPTPKRADARKARRTPGGSGARGGTAADPKARARAERQRQRQALLTGDERNLPLRDAGPEKRLARDVIDSRFTYGQVFIFVVVIIFFLGTFIPNRSAQNVSSLTGLVSLIVIFGDSYRHGRAARDAVTEKYGATHAIGIVSYGLLRAMLPRRFRRPPPKVARGGGPL